MLDTAQIRKLLDATDVLYRALILLGVNAGYGNGDCAALPLDAVDLDAGWIDFPRPKTAIARRCKLWPETVSALKEWLAVRPAPKDDDDAKLMFLTERGTALIRDTEKSRTDNITMMFSALTKAAKVHRPGLGFYVRRRVFRTVGDATLDRVACDVVMGHADASMGRNLSPRNRRRSTGAWRSTSDNGCSVIRLVPASIKTKLPPVNRGNIWASNVHGLT